MFPLFFGFGFSDTRARAWVLVLISLFGLCGFGGVALAQVDAAFDAGEAWLLEEQEVDGGFGGLEDLRPRDTSVTVLALSGRPNSELALDQAIAYLTMVTEANAEFRSHRALALAAHGSSPTALLASIGEFRNGGGMGAFTGHQSSLLDTAFVIQALTLEESTYQLDIVELLDYLQTHQGMDGGWGFVVTAPSEAYYSAETLQALADLDQLSIGDTVLDGVADYLLTHQQADGSFGSVLDTAVAYRALLALGRSETDFPHGSPIPYLLGQQLANGSWQDDVFTTAQVLRVLRAQSPNLTLEDLTLTPPSVLAGGVTEVSVTVRNVGPQDSGASHLALRRDAVDGELLQEIELPALAAGESSPQAFTLDTSSFSGNSVDLVVVADDRDAVEESSEDDNSDLARLSLRGGPDLALYANDLSLDPAQPEPNQDFDLLINARNLGESEVASFNWRVFRRVAGAPTDTLASGTAGPLAPGGAQLIPVTLNLPEGEHAVEVQLDDDGQVDEENEDNNMSSLSFFVVDPAQPDLALADPDVTLTPAQPAAGETVTLDVTVRNLGQRAASSELVIYENDPSDGGSELQRLPFSLEGDASTALQAVLTVGPAAHSYTLAVDVDGEILELDESNNRLQRFFRELPDLSIGYDNIELLPAKPFDGDLVAVTLTVRNAGTLDASNVSVELYDGDPSSGGVLVESATIDQVTASGNRSVNLQWSATGGRNELVAVVDGSDAILELSESNNRASRPVAVPRGTGPDLEVTGVDLALLLENPLSLELDGSVEVDLSNTGDADVSDAFQVRLFVDLDGNQVLDPGETTLGSALYSSGLAAGTGDTVTVDVSGFVPFHHPLVWAEVDATDVVAERREDNNHRSVFGDCAEAQIPATSTEPSFEWSRPGLNVETVPLVAQLSDDNGDGRVDSRDVADIVVQASDASGNGIFAVSGLDGSSLWTFRSSPANPLVDHLGQAALADIDGDGKVEIIGHQTNGRFVALEHDGTLKWVSDTVPGVGRRGLGGPAIGDLDADGVPEIALGRTVVDANGTRIAVGTGNAGENWNYYGPFGVVKVPGANSYPQAVIADVDLDGQNELIAGDTLYRLVNGSLEIVWNRTVPDNLMRDGWNAVGNFDGDPYAEIVYVSSGQIMVLNHDGSTHAGRRTMVGFIPFQMPTFWGGAPTVADLNGDGSADILVVTATHLIAYRGNLSTLWRKSIPEDFGGFTGVTAFDLDGDGVMEVLFNGERDLFVIDGRNGATLHTVLNRTFTAMEHPAVADVDGDGRAEIILPSNRDRLGSTETQGLHVLGNPSWQGARSIWNQYSYHVTNVGLDGTVPSPQTPPWQLHNGFRTNLGVEAPVAYLPNLTVSLPRSGEATQNGVPVLLRIGNGGREPVPGGIEVQLLDGPVGSSQVVGSAVTPTGLRPGQYLDMEVLWQGASAGDVTAYAVVDPSDAVTECDETDNAVSFSLTATVLPDLAVAAGGVQAASPVGVGSLVTVDVTVENLGIAASPSSILRLYQGDPASGPALVDVGVEPLEAGESRLVTPAWETLGNPAGIYNLHAVLDPDGEVLESDETNNRGLVQVELVGPSNPDLAALGLTADPDSITAGGIVRLTAEVVNRGVALEGGFEAGFFVNLAEVGRTTSLTTLGSGETRQLTFDLDTAALNGVLTVEVRFDPSGSVPEEDESNNTASATLTVDASPLQLRLETDQRSYNAGEDVQVTALANNQGDAPVDGVLTLNVVDSVGVQVAQIVSGPVNLSVGETALPYSWNTGSTLAGTYSIVGSLEVDGSVGASGSVLFSIAGQVEASASLFSDRDEYTPLQAVVLNGAVRNLGSNQPLDNLTARVRIAGPESGGDAGPQVFQVDVHIPQLLPGATRPLTAQWEVGNAVGGSYLASLELLDEAGLLIAYADTALQIEDSASTGSGLGGELTVTPVLVGAGAPLLAAFDVDNGGNADMPELQLRVDMRRLVDGELVASFTRPQPLPQGTMAHGVFGLPTAGLSEEDYLVSLVGILPGNEKRLDAQAVTVAQGISIADATLLEGDGGTSSAEFAVTLSSPSTETITVDFASADGTALAGQDYQAISGTLTFAPGETLKAISVPVFGDLTPEPNETFLVTLSGAVGIEIGDGQGLGTLLDEEGCSGPNLLVNGDAEIDSLDAWTQIDVTDGNGWLRRFADPVPLAGNGYFAYGGMNLQVELQQTMDLTAYSAQIDAGGQAFAFAGYVYSAAEQDEDTLQVLVEYLDEADNVLEVFDSAALTTGGIWQPVSDQRAAPVGTRQARLRLVVTEMADAGGITAFADQLELRSLGVPVVSALPPSFQEGNSGSGAVDLQLFLSCPAPATATLSYATADLPPAAPDAEVGSAIAGVDYMAAVGDLTLSAGDTTADLGLELIPDSLDEPDERFEVQLSTSDNLVVLTPTVEVLISDDDGAVSLIGVPVATLEGPAGSTTPVDVTLRLSALSGRQVSVGWNTAAGSASAGQDFEPASGTVVFAPGVLEQTVTLQVVGDGVHEPEETFALLLSSPVNVTLTQPEVTLTVQDDDPVEIAVADAPRVDEGDSGTTDMVFTVSLSVPSVLPVSVDYATADPPAGTDAATAGVDYQSVAGTLTFAPGTTSLTVTVPVIADLEREPEEIFLLRLSNPTVGSLHDPEAIGSIFDDDGILISVSDQVVIEGPGNLSFLPTSTVRASSSFNNSWLPSRAVDNNLNTSWFTGANDTANAGQSPWIEVEFAEDTPVTQIRMFGNRQFANGHDFFSGVFQVFDVDGNVLWDSGDTALPGPTRDLVVNVPQQDNARRVRFTSTADESIDPGLSEFHVMGIVPLETSVTVSLSKAATFPVSVDYQTVDGTALVDSDYLEASGTLNFDPGVTSIDVPLFVIGDTIGEPLESFFVQLSNAVESLILDGEGEISIIDTEIWRTNGQGSITAAAPGCVRLVPDNGNNDGSAWRLDKIDLAENFDKTFRVYLGTRDSNGSDGLVFTLQNEGLTALGGHGGALGNYPITPAFSVEVDTHDNGNYDPTADHISFLRNGRYWEPLKPGVQASPTSANVEDGQEHIMRVVWNAEAQQVDAIFDGEHRTFFDGDLVTDFFSGTSDVFYGFTAGNGYWNEHYFCEQQLCADGSAPQLSIGNGYLTEGDGSGSAVMSIPVTLSCPASQAFTVDYVTSDVTAFAGSDYDAVSGTLSFAPGETSAWVNVTVHADDISERDETFVVDLSNLQGDGAAQVSLWYDQGIGNILTDDVVWHLNGYARENVVPGCIQLTPHNGRYSASAWRSDRIDLTQHFDMTFDVYVGTIDGGGADGLVFALQNESSSVVGGFGASLGWSGIAPAVGVELDTYDNGGYDPSVDHLAMNTNGSITNGQSTAVQASATAGNVEDGQRHSMRLIWNAANTTLDVHFDDADRLLYTRDIVAEVFGGSSEVWWGFTGANWAPNEHYFCPTLNCFGTDGNPRISVGEVDLLEGNGGSSLAHFPVTLHCPAEHPVTVRVETANGTALAGEDYAAKVETFTFQPGETHKTFSVEVFGDLDPESTEVFYADLSQPSGGEIRYQRGDGTIISDDILISVRQAGLVEGNGGNNNLVVDLELSDPAPVTTTVQMVSSDGTAIVDQDYVAVSRNVTFNAGSRVATTTLTVIGDGVPEDDETFFLDFTAPDGARIASNRVELTIQDDDNCPGGNLLVNGSAEEHDGETFVGWVEETGTDWRRAQSNGPVDGSWYFWPGNVPFGRLSQEVDVSSFAPRIDLGLQTFVFEGFMRSFNENPPDLPRILVEYRNEAGDVLDVYDTGEVDSRTSWRKMFDLRPAPAGTRTIKVVLEGRRQRGTSNDARIDLLSLRPLEWPTFSVVDGSVVEGESGQRMAELLVQQSCVSTVATTVDYLTADGTATAGTDYEATSGTLVLQPGETSTTVQVPVFGDTLSEVDETFHLDLVNARNAGIGRARGTVTILQDEVLLVPGNISVTEGNSGTVDAVFPLTLSAPSTLPITVDYYTGGGGASSSMNASENIDYISTTGSVTFQPGETVKTVTVQVLGDLEVESDETFRLYLDNPINVTLSDTRGYCDILDDDVEVSVADATVQEGDSGQVTAIFNVTLSKVTSNSVTVNWATEEGLATAGVDYVEASGSVTFAPGDVLEEIRVNVLGDTELENSETFIVRLTGSDNAMLADDEGVGMIIDDDDCPGPNLLRNGSFETLAGSEVTDWIEVVGTDWRTSTGGGGRRPVQGSRFLFAGPINNAELRQNIDLSPFQAFIDAGLQRFAFEGFVSTGNGQQDTARIVLEYMDVNSVVIETFDTGEVVDSVAWRQVADMRRVPVGTRSVAVRLISRRTDTGNLDAYYDQLTFRSVGTPIMSVEDLEIPEGDTSSVFADFDIQLTCAHDKLMHLDYQTVDGTATTADDDYIGRQGTLTFGIGEDQQTLSIEIPGDFKNELLETFTVEFSNEVEMVLLDRIAQADIRDADPGAAPVPGVFAVYTEDDQFDTGSLVSVHHDTPLNDQLQLVENGSTFPFIWIALSDFGTIVKIDVETGEILGEYSTSPDNRGSNPSRTTVALDGSVWVGNRNGQSVTHVGLPELNQCVDRNGNGFIDTSVGLGNVLPWPNLDGSDSNGGVSTAEDECIIHHVQVAASGTRHITVDKDNNVWVSGTGSGRPFDLIDGTTGTFIRRETGFACGGYGGLIDGDGVIWSITSGGSVLRWDPSVVPPTAESKRCIGGTQPYGIAIDSDGWIWISSFSGNRIRKVSPDGNTILGPFGHGTNGAQGLAVDANDDVWTSNNLFSNQTQIGHNKKDGTYVGNVTNTCRSSTGVAVDANGKIWVACYSDGKAARIDPTGGPIGADGVTPIGITDLVVDLGGSRPYNYSDMTGAVALRATAPQGTFSAIQDSGIDGAEWGNVSWNTEPEAFIPDGGSIIVEVRAADTVPGLGSSEWLTIDSGISFEIYGRFLQVRATLRPSPDGVSPVLSDLRIGVIDDANVTLGDAVIDEGDPGDGVQAIFPVTFSESTVLDTTFTYTTVDGTAVAGEDYVAATGTVVIPAGQTTGQIVIDIVSDEVQEGDESFTVILSDPQNAIFVDGEGSGTIIDDDVPALAVTKVDVHSLDQLGDGDVSPGDQVTYDIVVSNVGTGVATGITLDDTIPANATLLAGTVTSTQGSVTTEDPVAVSLGDIQPGASATVSFAVQVDDPFPVEVDEIVNQATVQSAETGAHLSDDPDTAEADDSTRTPVVGLPDLTVRKVDALSDDADNDGQVSPGDTLRYTVTVSNVGDGSASGVTLSDVIPTHTSVVPGSVSSVSDGVDIGTVDGDDPVSVSLGLLAAGEAATITFDVTIDSPLPVGVTEVVNQASVDSDQLDMVLSDDPDVAGDADPTVTPVITTPSLDAVKTATLTTDLDGDGVVNPGDTLTYEVVVTSDGNTGATAVLFTDLIPDFTVLEAGSVEAREGINDPAGVSVGTVLSEDPIEVDLGTLESGASVTVSFRVAVADPFPEGVDVVINQALIASAELEDVLSDDPATPEEDDPTVTPVVIPGQTTVCEAVPFGDLGDVTWTLNLLGDADQGEATVVDDRLHLSGDGTSLYHALDNGAFYHHEVGSDADYRLEVSVTDFPVDEGGQVRKAALMLRTSTDPLAARVMVTFVPHLPGANPGDPETTGIQFDARLSDGGNAVEIGNTVFGAPLGTRLAIEKKGDVATAYYSVDDGATWIQGIDATYGGSATIDWAASGETLRAGVMVASYDAQVPVTAEFANFEVCRPDIDPPVDPPNPPDCDAEQALDVIVMMDVSGSMTASFPGTGSKLEAAKLAFDRLVTELASAPSGTRLGLITAGGFRTPEENLAGAYTILSPLTTDFSAVNALAQGIDGSLIDPGVPTPTALALKGVVDSALPQFDDANQPILLWLSDGIANIDILGRGPEPYELEEVQAISLRDANGDFLSWGEVGWSGDFNESIGTFDGEPLANAMYQLERMQSREPDLMVYGVALQGDGIDLGTFNPGLMEYAAHVSGGRSFTADDTTSLVASIVASSNDAMCEVGTASLGGRLWQDRDGDGQQSLDTVLESGLVGVTVNLFDDMGFGVTSTQTDGSGSYVFGQLPAGSYTMQVDASTLPSGDNGLPIDVATYDLDGIDTPETIDTATASVTDGEVRGDVSFGYRERDPAPPVEICEVDAFEDASLDPAWQFVQIGDADQGSVAELDGTLQLTSDGTSLFHGTDNGSLVYRPESGDFRAQVRVADIPVDEGGPVRKGCLMVRSGTGDLDARVMACYIPHLPNTTTQAIQFDARRENGTAEEIADFVINAILPVEMAIVREGNVLRVEYSLDRGQTWIQPDGLLGGEVTVDLGTSPVLGVMVASYDSGVTTTVAFDNFEVCRPNPDLP